MLSSLQNTAHLRPVIRVECGQRKSFSLYYIRQKKIKVWHHSHRQIDFNVIVYWKQCINCLLLSQWLMRLCPLGLSGTAFMSCYSLLFNTNAWLKEVHVVAYLLSMRLCRVLHLLHLSITCFVVVILWQFLITLYCHVWQELYDNIIECVWQIFKTTV